MALDVQTYPGKFNGLAENLLPSLQAFQESRSFVADIVRGSPEVVGPVRIYVLDPDDVVANDDDGAILLARRSGWRALINFNNEPLSLAEISFASDGAELYSIRNREAATAFHAMLRRSLDFVEEPGRFDVRWLSIPDVYVSALWLAAERSVFIPARLGSAERPGVVTTSWTELRELVLPLIEAARPPADFVERDSDSPRSGLPR